MIINKIINKVLQELDKYSLKPSRYSFIMTEGEKDLFGEKIKSSKVYLEFGMGGSTFYALQNSKAKVYSVDSSSDWIKVMRQYVLIRKMEKKRLSIFHIDIGPITRDAGYPDGRGSRALYPNYSASIFKLIEKDTVDTILVDGRFRVACTLKAIMECHTCSNLLILIYDFWNRKEYHMLLSYLLEINRVDTLGVFEIKKDINMDKLEEDYELYKYDPV